MRALHKLWKDQSPFTKRVKWYEQREPLSIRLAFEDLAEHRRLNMFYSDREAAQADYDAFIAGTLTIVQMLERE